MNTQIVPIPRSPMAVRAATMADLPFMDALQKAHTKQLGYFPTKQFEGYVASGGVLIAVGAGSRAAGGDLVSPSCRSTEGDTSVAPTEQRLGYVISRDRYLKRDELGVVYQLCVAPGTQRKQVGAALIKAVFERSAYKCRLYCCWCARDIEANRFWESLGFLPIAFRAGSDAKRRVHIFWQRRINADDHVTPYWFPSKTEAGAIREDRLVFPIPPGTHWSEVKAVELPTCGTGPVLEDRTHGLKTRATKNGPPQQPVRHGPRQFGPPPATPVVETPVTPAKKPPREKRKIDPQFVAKARELRDRYLEHVNGSEQALVPQGKYDVSRTLTSALSAVEGGAVEQSRALHINEPSMPLLAAG